MKRLHGAVLGLCVLAGPALADDCKPLAIVASVDLETTKEHDAVFAPVTLDGKVKYLLVDTGGALSELTKETADELNLDREPVNVAVIDVSGRESHEAGRVKNLSIGNLHASNVDFIISRDNPFGDGNTDIAGILGPDILANYDTEFDFGAEKMSLLSPDHCPGKVIYWPAAAVAVVPIEITSQTGHITFPITLDGKQVTAELDTGAQETVVNLGTAEENYGITPTSPGVKSLGAMENTHGAQQLEYRFKTLTFGDADGGLTVGNFQAILLPNLQGQPDEMGAQHTGTKLPPKNHERAGLPEMLLGMNVLKHLHIYIAYGEKKLYITPASPPPAAAKP
jgi:predicted aspartyl protease